MTTDDDIRDMLRAKAREATVSPDAWDTIALRLHEPERKVSQLPRRLTAVATVAAVAAGIVVLANRPHDDGPATQATSTTAGPATTFRQVDPEFVRSVVDDWVHARVPGVVMGTIHQTVQDDGTVTVRFTGGELGTELLLRPTNDGQGLEVASASSDLVLIDNPTYDGHDLVAEVIPAVVGRMTVTYVIDGDEVPGAERDVSHETEHLGYPAEGASTVAVRVVLRGDDGVVGLAEEAATPLRDPATVAGSYVAMFPATDAAGLATLQQQADDHRREDLLDPQNVAGNALFELLPKGETSTSYALGDFQLGDPTSGEVPYTLSDGSKGVVQLRRTGDDRSRIWYVTGLTSEGLEVLRYRHEPGALVVDVRATAAGTLTLAGGDAPIEVQAGQKVSISRTEGPSVQTGMPVELRLRAGRKTLAVLAQLPR